MPFWRTYYHLVWATKERAPLIRPNIETSLYNYLLKKAAEHGVRVYALNGWTDHLHMVASIPPRISIADVVKGLKGASSHYVNQDIMLPDHFAWQRGYGVFTLGESQRATAEAYVARQKEHHARQTTNSWLERTNEFDEGPPDEGLSMWSEMSHSIKEEHAIYMATTATEPFPF
jgi:REP element-mobilizing transposase RayT